MLFYWTDKIQLQQWMNCNLTKNPLLPLQSWKFVWSKLQKSHRHHQFTSSEKKLVTFFFLKILSLFQKYFHKLAITSYQVSSSISCANYACGFMIQQCNNWKCSLILKSVFQTTLNYLHFIKIQSWFGEHSLETGWIIRSIQSKLYHYTDGTCLVGAQ